jgi:hypothetical protein
MATLAAQFDLVSRHLAVFAAELAERAVLRHETLADGVSALI